MIFNNQGIFGFDISRWQRVPEFNGQPAKEVNFSMMKESGASFVIIKAGQLNYADPGFYYNWEAAKEACIPRGSYWFEDFRASPTAQARKYWSLIKDDVGEGICAMDFESGSHNDLNSAYLFLNEFQQLSGLPDHKIAVYTGHPYWTNARNNAQRSWFRKFVLWEAWYPYEFNNYSIVKVPYPWGNDECRIWQNATPAIGLAVGVHSREIDHNFFNGDSELFKLYFDETGDIPMPEITFTGKVKSTVTSGAIVRLIPNGADSGQRLPANATIEGVGALVQAGNYTWMNIITPLQGWVATSLLEYAPVTPPATNHKLEVILDGEIVFTKEF